MERERARERERETKNTTQIYIYICREREVCSYVLKKKFQYSYYKAAGVCQEGRAFGYDATTCTGFELYVQLHLRSRAGLRLSDVKYRKAFLCLEGKIGQDDVWEVRMKESASQAQYLCFLLSCWTPRSVLRFLSALPCNADKMQDSKTSHAAPRERRSPQ